MKPLCVLGVLFLLAQVSAGCSDPYESRYDEGANPEQLLQILGAAETPAITCLSPQNLVTIVSLGATTPVTVTFQTNMAAELEDGVVTLAYRRNGVVLGTQQDTKPVTYDLPFGEHVLTLAFLAGGLPVLGESARCSVQVRVTRSCINNDDCQDDFYCNTVACVAVGGGEKLCKFGPADYAGCCESNDQCAYGQYCDTGKKVCTSCVVDGQCDDGNSCTTDSCMEGACISITTDLECCDCNSANPAGQCDDGLLCTNDGCNCAQGSCTHEAKVMSQGGVLRNR
jgi:hypothetical protein